MVKSLIAWGISFIFFWKDEGKKSCLFRLKIWTEGVFFPLSLMTPSPQLGKQLSELYPMIVD